MKLKVLITREINAAEATAVAVEALGYEAVVWPLIEVEAVEYEFPKDFAADYLIITSLNAAKTLKVCKIPCLVVGQRSADYLLEKGFNVAGAYLDADDLLREMLSSQRRLGSSNDTLLPSLRAVGAAIQPFKPKAWKVSDLIFDWVATPSARNDEGWKFLYLSADHIATNIPKALRAMGCEVRRVVVYKSKIAPTFNYDILKDINFATFYSPRTAEAFYNLCKTQPLSHITALALSQNVANRLENLEFKRVFVADEPNEKSLLEGLPLVG